MNTYNPSVLTKLVAAIEKKHHEGELEEGRVIYLDKEVMKNIKDAPGAKLYKGVSVFTELLM